MHSTWIYTGCDTEDERNLAAVWRRLEPALDAALSSSQVPLEEAVFSVVHSRDSKPSWEIQGVLIFPARTVSGAVRGLDPEATLEQLSGILAKEVARQELPTDDRRRVGLGRLQNFLESARDSDNLRAFAGFLSPLLASLRGHAAREIALRESEDELLTGQLQVDEVLDETLLEAWEHFEERPRELALDAWLVGLMSMTLEIAVQDRGASESLDDTVEQPRLRPVDEEESLNRWIDRPQTGRETTLADLLPDDDPHTVWEQLPPERRAVGLNYLIGRLPKPQRQALLLQAAHGLTTEEIAIVENLTPAEVETLLAAAREHLRTLLDKDAYWRELQEAH